MKFKKSPCRRSTALALSEIVHMYVLYTPPFYNLLIAVLRVQYVHTRTHAVVFSLCFYVREYTSYSEKIRKFNQIYKIQPGTDNTSLSFKK